MIRKLPKKLRKRKKVRDLVPQATAVAQRAANMNPLSDRNDDSPIVEDVPRITNETISIHREEVLKGARKYIYPLQHSKHRIVLITSVIAVTAVVAFMVYCSVALYRLYQHNTFLYRVTQVVPFPIARVGDSFIEYENYLFELRRNIHYYQNQQPNNSEDEDMQRLDQSRKQALQDVINQAYIKKLAKENKIGVGNKEVEARISVVRDQNRLGNNNKVLSDVLRNYWGWSISDFKRSLKTQILAEKVVAKLDTATKLRADAILAQAKSGADFSTLARQFSDDEAAKASGGDFGAPITRSNPNIPPQVTEALFKLKPGEVSGIISTGRTLEVLKVQQNDGASVTAQHISINLKDISEFIDPLKKKQQPKNYVKF
ncbi:peptidylprolyl isomerase [Candidatus Saccharibacteria bacterium]|nr:peptidylprolyl isomerase [Candidatus Saccharibacteria bacterium]